MVSKSALSSESLDKVEIKASEKLQEKSELPSCFHKRDQEAQQLSLTAPRGEGATPPPPRKES